MNHLPQETLVYCDPPYFERAERLYLSVYNKADHVRLAKFVQGKLKRPWVVSYDSPRCDLADVCEAAEV